MPIASIKNISQRLAVIDVCHFIFRYLSECDVDALLRSAHIIIFPHNSCDASGAIMRAIPFGKPIVVSRVGGFGELFQNATQRYLFPPRDVNKLAAIITDLLSNEGSYRDAAACIDIMHGKVPSWARIAQKTEKVYLQCIENRYDS